VGGPLIRPVTMPATVFARTRATEATDLTRPPCLQTFRELGETMDGLISVFVCGVQKGGTTSFFAHLCEHPALSPPARKELHYFDDESTDWTDPDYGRIEAFFSAGDKGRLRFEATPIYGFWPPSMERIQKYNPAAKLILLFRDPFERAWSHWCMEYARSDESLPFAAAIREGRRRLDGLPPLASEHRVYSYLERGFYAKQVRRIFNHFPREQVLCLRSLDLWDDHVATLTRVSEFLRIPPFPDTGPKREHLRPRVVVPAAPTEADQELIARQVRDDVLEFSVLTGVDVSDWPVMNDARAAREAPMRSAVLS
jgi:hypothetical protein